ncbi:hypothetical protein CFC21_093830, partial [Triticum aestivum]
VHHLIEKCICFNLNKEGCMEALCGKSWRRRTRSSS